MNKYKFDMSNIKNGKAKKQMILLVDDEKNLYLGLEDAIGNLTTQMKVLEISKLKKLTNFFIRVFNVPLIGKNEDEQTIPLEDLTEVERKIVIVGENDDEIAEEAVRNLNEQFSGSKNEKKGTYPRTMIYLDTENGDFDANSMVFRLTQEGAVVKATVHMNNNLQGDKKYINKFFFKDTNLGDVQRFFSEAFGLKPITKEINSIRTEYDTSFGEVSVDKFKDEHAEYSVIELELDSYNRNGEPKKTSEEMTEIAKDIARRIGAEECSVVDNGTERIFEEVSGKPFFEAYKTDEREQENKTRE